MKKFNLIVFMLASVLIMSCSQYADWYGENGDSNGQSLSCEQKLKVKNAFLDSSRVYWKFTAYLDANGNPLPVINDSCVLESKVYFDTKKQTIRETFGCPPYFIFDEGTCYLYSCGDSIYLNTNNLPAVRGVVTKLTPT